MSNKILWKNIILYIYPIVILVGVFGNILAFIIFSRKNFKNTIFRVYFRVLVINDIYTLSYLATSNFLDGIYEIVLINGSDLLCKLKYISIYAIPANSSWILVVISLDRSISIIKPKKFSFKNNYLFQICVCVFITLFNLVYYFQLYFSKIETINSNNSTNNTKCNYYDPNNTLDWLDFFNSILIPFILMIIFTIVSLKSIFNSRKKVRNISSTKNTDKTYVKDTKFATTSIVLNLLFLTLNMPSYVYNIIRMYSDISNENKHLIEAIVFLFYYVNFGSVFFINALFNSLFKQELKVFFSAIGNKM